MSHKSSSLKYFGATDVGQVRDHNEDSFVIIDLSHDEQNARGTIFMVADGMGGANAGEVASAIACNVVEDRFLKLQKIPDSSRNIEKYLKNLLLEAHQQIIQHAEQHPECEGMGTTAVLAWVIGEDLHIVWCGDSRCYVFAKDQQHTLSPFTDDHSLVWQMVLSGELNAEEARLHEQSNIILQVLGSKDSTPKPSYLSKKISNHEYILLCSDGLNGMLSDASLQQILVKSNDVQETTSALIEAAKQAGGTDNITAILALVEDTPLPPSAPKKNFFGKLKSKWSMMLILTVILLVLLFSIIGKEEKKSTPSESTDQNQPALSTHHTQEADNDRKIADQVLTPLPSQPEDSDNKVAESMAENDPTDTYNFLASLKKLDQKLNLEINSTREWIEGCKTCNNNPQLENINESLSATHELIKEQIDRASLNLPITKQSKEKLFSISQSVSVSYDMKKTFNADDNPGEQEYMINTMNEVIMKISETLETLTKKVQ